MRIALVHTRYMQRGGEEVAFESEARLLADHGCDVHVIVADNAELASMPRAAAGLAAVWNEKWRGKLADEFRAIDPDVVHFHNTFPLLSPAVYHAVPRRAAIVQTLHNYRLVCPAATLLRGTQVCESCVGRAPVAAVRHGCYRDSRAASAVVAIMLQVHRAMRTWDRVDAFIALTPFASRVLERGGLPSDRLHVKPNFVDPDPGAGDHEGSYYLFVGRLDRQKGVSTLLEAFTWTGLPLRIIGAGPLAREVHAAATNSSNIEYMAAVPPERVLAEMRAARALIVPSVSYECLPLVIVEALATGLPIISSDMPNLRDLAATRGAGWVFRSGDAADLARVVREVDAQPAARRAASETARRLFESEYTREVNYRQLERVYQSARRRREAA